MVPEVVITDDTQRPSVHSAKRVTFRLLLAGWTAGRAVQALKFEVKRQTPFPEYEMTSC